MVHKKPMLSIPELITIFYSKRFFLMRMVGIFFLIGVLLAFTAQKEYSVSIKLIPETNDGMKSGLGSLGNLAGLAGFQLNSTGVGSLSPELYPEVARSIPFQIKLLRTPIYFVSIDSVVTCEYYFSEVKRESMLGSILKYTIGLPSLIKSLIFDSQTLGNQRELGILNLTKHELELVEIVQGRVDVDFDRETGLINVHTEMPDPTASAMIANMVLKELKERITQYQIGKSKDNLDFIQEQFNSKRDEFYQKQKELAEVTDRNKNINSKTAQLDLERVQNEYSILFEVYKNLATQLEQAKIAVNENTPIFTVIEPVRIPVEKSKPKRVVLILTLSFVGVFSGILWVLLTIYYKENFKGLINANR